MTEIFSLARCDKCGAYIAFEDGIRQDFCLCDPWCECCGEQFIPSPGRDGTRICDRCVEEEAEGMFSEEFLKSLSGRQMSLLIRDVGRILE